ncbi:MAG: phosphoglycerate kinase [Phycisphaerales bacterium]|nr:MAG: phosphoglycerate kinase [Phycisphaerales bacterium]
MAKKTIDQVDFRSKRVLMRVDFNVPQDDNGNITDDRRIRKALPSIRHILDAGGRLILMSHLGRPKGDPEKDKKYTLAPVAECLGQLIGDTVLMADDCVGDDVRRLVDGLHDGKCCLLENLRFHAAETIKDKDAAKDSVLKEQKQNFAQQLADLADVYVNDAFGTCHRDNASMLTVPQLMAGKPRVVGYLVRKELQFLGEALAKPRRPFIAILGGAKVSDKIGVIESLLPKCDHILIGGAMCFTFQLAAGQDVGNSLVEKDKLDEARRLRDMAGDKLKLPFDTLVAEKLEAGVAAKVAQGPIPPGFAGYDIGPKTTAAFCNLIAGAGTVVWNGPMGVFETPPFDVATMTIARTVAEATDRGAVTIIGGGDSAAAVDKAGLEDRMTHVSTGGGASLEFLEGKPFKPIEVLDDAD